MVVIADPVQLGTITSPPSNRLVSPDIHCLDRLGKQLVRLPIFHAYGRLYDAPAQLSGERSSDLFQVIAAVSRLLVQPTDTPALARLIPRAITRCNKSE